MNKLICSILAASVLVVLPAQAAFTTYGFDRITSNSSDNIADQLFVDLVSYDHDFSTYEGGIYNGLNLASTQVLFHFKNVQDVTDTGTGAISEIYFDDGSLLGISYLIDNDDGGALGDANVDFSPSSANNNSNTNLPSGENIDFQASSPYSMFVTDEDPGAANMVQIGEYLGVIFDLETGMNYQSVVDALALGAANPGLDVDGGLRIGIHGQQIGPSANDSDSFVNSGVGGGAAIPEPSTYAMFGMAFAMLGFVGYRSRNKKS